MNAEKGFAAPASGSFETQIPTFEELEADPEITALLEFEPVPRQIVKANGWTPAMQRMFIAWLAWYGSPTKACDELGKARSGVDKLYKAADAAEFRASWDEAIALYERRRIARTISRHGGSGSLRAPTLPRAHAQNADARPLQDGQVLNEYGEPEDEDSYCRRAEDASDSLTGKLLRIRRLYLREISSSPGKRAAFEILTELPIDWDAAERLEPQADEPFRTRNQRKPDMILLAESGWSFGEYGYGPDKQAERRKAIDEHRAAEGLPPVDWDADSEEENAEKGPSPDDRDFPQGEDENR